VSDAGALRLGVIGCGRVFARYHLPAIRATPEVSLAAACEIDPSRRAWAATVLDGAPCYATPEPLFDVADALLVATPPAAHAAAVELALQRGMAVLVEKPMTLTAAEAQRIVTAQQRGGLVRVGFNRRFRASYVRLRRRVQADGDTAHVAFTFIADARRWNADAPAVSSPEDVLHDAGSHAVDLIAHLARRPIRRIRAEVRNEARSSCRIELEAELEGGVAARCTVGHGSRYEEHLSVSVAGRRHMVDTWGRTGLARLREKGKLALCKLTGRPTATDDSFRAQLAAFAAVCRGETAAGGADALAGFAAVAAIERCIESIMLDGAWRDVPVYRPAKEETVA
jgi:predicted dehydrogenase